MEHELQQVYPQIDVSVIRYILNNVAGGNKDLASETLGVLRPQDINELKERLQAGGQLTQTQKDNLTMFKEITGASQKIAEKYLEQNAWQLEDALNFFYLSGAVGAGTAFKENNELEELFNSYKKHDAQDEEEGYMKFAALGKLCDDLGVVDPETDPLILIVAWLLKAKGSYKLSKAEWIEGLTDLGVTSLQEMKDQIPSWRLEITRGDKFKDFYKFVFGFATDQKAIRGADAAALWKIILADRYAKLDTWCNFITEQYKKAITRDTWNLFLDFIETVPSDFSTYDPDAGAWPLVIDEFVEFAKKQRK